MTRANFIGAPAFFNLNQACRVISDAFGFGSVFLVGSALDRRDFRDVDVRCILDDVEYGRLFPGIRPPSYLNPLWSLLCSSISLYLSQHSGLPVDFQIQQQTAANEMYNGKRSAIGVFVNADATTT